MRQFEVVGKPPRSNRDTVWAEFGSHGAATEAAAQRRRVGWREVYVRESMTPRFGCAPPQFGCAPQFGCPGPVRSVTTKTVRFGDANDVLSGYQDFSNSDLGQVTDAIPYVGTAKKVVDAAVNFVQSNFDTSDSPDPEDQATVMQRKYRTAMHTLLAMAEQSVANGDLASAEEQWAQALTNGQIAKHWGTPQSTIDAIVSEYPPLPDAPTLTSTLSPIFVNGLHNAVANFAPTAPPAQKNAFASIVLGRAFLAHPLVQQAADSEIVSHVAQGFVPPMTPMSRLLDDVSYISARLHQIAASG